jgi:hypothetical protein
MNIHKVTNMIKRYKMIKYDKNVQNGYSIKIDIRTETCQKVLLIFKFHFGSSSRSRANFNNFIILHIQKIIRLSK